MHRDRIEARQRCFDDKLFTSGRGGVCVSSGHEATGVQKPRARSAHSHGTERWSGIPLAPLSAMLYPRWSLRPAFLCVR